MKNLLCIIPNASDATSFYRGIGPLSELRKHTPGVSYLFPKQASWSDIAWADAVFMQRPYQDVHVQMIEMAKKQGKKVWVDYDDDLFSVEVSNPTYDIYGKEEVKKNVAKILAMADEITVTNEYLRKTLDFKDFDGKFTVVPNAFNEHIIQRYERKNRRLNRLAFWRGSKTHQKDVLQVAGDLKRAIEENPDVVMAFSTEVSQLWFLAESMPKERTVFVEPTDIIDYFKMLSNMNPLIVLCPLASSHFNKSKSNIAWIEGCYAGAVTLAPDWEQWVKPGVINYGAGSFHKQLDYLLKMAKEDPAQLGYMADEGWEYIERNLFLKTVNKQRKEILERII